MGKHSDVGIFAALHQRGFLENFVIDVDSMRFSRCFVFLGFSAAAPSHSFKQARSCSFEAGFPRKPSMPFDKRVVRSPFMTWADIAISGEWAELAPESAIEAA